MSAEQSLEAKSVDTRGQLCPLPVINAQLAITTMEPGQVLKLVASDPGAWADVPAWARNAGHSLLRQEKDPDGSFLFWVQRQ